MPLHGFLEINPDMEIEHTDNFYKDKAWELLQNDIREIKKTQEAQGADLQEIKARIGYVYGFAAAIGVFLSVIVEWIWPKLFK